MSHCFNCPPADPIFTDPTVVYQDYYYPQVVPIVHTVEIVKRHHCVPVPKHCYNYVVRDENIVGTVSAYRGSKRAARKSRAKRTR
ncbi:hypothetical protein CPT76_22275 [Paenibacillus sp. AR247]|nr:hypothetical protein CPT76_22275 [Paenibacillus sp. AR247]